MVAAKKRNVEASRRRVLAYLQEHPCVDCGERDPVLLDLDHVRGDKVESVSFMVRNNTGWQAIEAEIAKCEVRCANCHRRKTGTEQRWFRARAG